MAPEQGLPHLSQAELATLGCARIPPWPEMLIAPVDRELARWTQLWNLPNAPAQLR